MKNLDKAHARGFYKVEYWTDQDSGYGYMALNSGMMEATDIGGITYKGSYSIDSSNFEITVDAMGDNPMGAQLVQGSTNKRIPLNFTLKKGGKFPLITNVLGKPVSATIEFIMDLP